MTASIESKGLRKSSLVPAQLPLGRRSFAERLAEVHRRIARIRDSYEPVPTFGLQYAVARSPAPLGLALSRYFPGKAVGVLTNVPGPRAPMTPAGAPVEGIVGWAPCSGHQAITICVFSYAGQVRLGTDRSVSRFSAPRRAASGLPSRWLWPEGRSPGPCPRRR